MSVKRVIWCLSSAGLVAVAMLGAANGQTDYKVQADSRPGRSWEGQATQSQSSPTKASSLGLKTCSQSMCGRNPISLVPFRYAPMGKSRCRL